MKVTIPKKPDPNAWIGEKLIAQGDELMAAMAAKRLNGAEDMDDTPETEPAPEPVPRDPAAERKAFAELLKFFADTPEADTEFEALSEEEFAAESFTPPVNPPEEQS